MLVEMATLPPFRKSGERMGHPECRPWEDSQSMNELPIVETLDFLIPSPRRDWSVVGSGSIDVPGLCNPLDESWSLIQWVFEGNWDSHQLRSKHMVTKPKSKTSTNRPHVKATSTARRDPTACRPMVPAAYRFPTSPKGMLDWGWAYWTYERSARVVAEPPSTPAPR